LQGNTDQSIPYFLQLLTITAPTLFTELQWKNLALLINVEHAGPMKGILSAMALFSLKEWKINRRITVERNPYYWNADNVGLNQVVFYPTENVTTEERMFRAGQLHYSGIPSDKIEVYTESTESRTAYSTLFRVSIFTA
jgi:oligopeptide transport system substrate-binding protein